MNNEDLRDSLEKLHLELLQMPPAEKPLQDKRDALAAHIREALDKDDLSEFNLTMKEFLGAELLSFEESHPKVAQLIGGIKDMLAAIGI